MEKYNRSKIRKFLQDHTIKKMDHDEMWGNSSLYEEGKEVVVPVGSYFPHISAHLSLSAQSSLWMLTTVLEYIWEVPSRGEW